MKPSTQTVNSTRSCEFQLKVAKTIKSMVKVRVEEFFKTQKHTSSLVHIHRQQRGVIIKRYLMVQ